MYVYQHEEEEKNTWMVSLEWKKENEKYNIMWKDRKMISSKFAHKQEDYYVIEWNKKYIFYRKQNKLHIA